MATALRTNEALQIQSFWNLIQASEEGVQKGLFQLLSTKYAPVGKAHRHVRSSFFALKGVLKSGGDSEMDRKLLDGYLSEKYGV